MPGKMRIRVEGLSALDRELRQFAPKIQKSVERRAIRRAMKPMMELAKTFAPFGTGDLEASIRISVSTRRGFVTATMGPSRKVSKDDAIKAMVQEFGSVRMPIPNSYMRPAWDADHRAMLERLKVELRHEIDRALSRA
jgi:hypothetical protein